MRDARLRFFATCCTICATMIRAPAERGEGRWADTDHKSGEDMTPRSFLARFLFCWR